MSTTSESESDYLHCSSESGSSEYEDSYPSYPGAGCSREEREAYWDKQDEDMQRRENRKLDKLVEKHLVLRAEKYDEERVGRWKMFDLKKCCYCGHPHDGATEKDAFMLFWREKDVFNLHKICSTCNARAHKECHMNHVGELFWALAGCDGKICGSKYALADVSGFRCWKCKTPYDIMHFINGPFNPGRISNDWMTKYFMHGVLCKHNRFPDNKLPNAFGADLEALEKEYVKLYSKLGGKLIEDGIPGHAVGSISSYLHGTEPLATKEYYLSLPRGGYVCTFS